MSYTKLTETFERDGQTIQRVVEERTCRVEIITPLSPQGPAAYNIVIYREWAEYENGVLTKITKLPPLHMPFTSQLVAFLNAVSTRLDMYAKQKNTERAWPKLNGVMMTP